MQLQFSISVVSVFNFCEFLMLFVAFSELIMYKYPVEEYSGR